MGQNQSIQGWSWLIKDHTSHKWQPMHPHVKAHTHPPNQATPAQHHYSRSSHQANWSAPSPGPLLFMHSNTGPADQWQALSINQTAPSRHLQQSSPSTMCKVKPNGPASTQVQLLQTSFARHFTPQARKHKAPHTPPCIRRFHNQSNPQPRFQGLAKQPSKQGQTAPPLHASGAHSTESRPSMRTAHQLTAPSAAHPHAHSKPKHEQQRSNLAASSARQSSPHGSPKPRLSSSPNKMPCASPSAHKGIAGPVHLFSNP